MKIALFTIWHCGNFGAEMQAYATVKILSELGHEVEIVDFRIQEPEHKSLKSCLVSNIEAITPAYRKFVKFWETYFPKISRHYHTLAELKGNPPHADVYLVGSDQVWNPIITGDKAEAYLLGFAPPGTKLVSFSSSFGTSSWQGSADLTQLAKTQFAKFSLLCCREKSGVDILKLQFGVNAQHTIDPTLLYDDYYELTGPVEEKNTLVYYPLSENPEMEKYCLSLADRLGLEFVNVNKKVMLTNTIAWSRTGIIDWLREIAGAKLVITPSFHGLAFSLIYKRNFIIIENNVNKKRSDRITDLLADLNLSNRFFESIPIIEKSMPWIEHIDYDNITNALRNMRTELRELLSGI